MQRYHLRNPGILLPSLVPDNSGSWVSWKDATEKILQLQAIVDKIPIMADGEPVIAGEEVFVRWNDGTIKECTILGVHQDSIRTYIKMGKFFTEHPLYVDLSQVYKTRQAAEQIDTTSKGMHQKLTEAILNITEDWREGDHTWKKHLELLESAVKEHGNKQ